MYVIPLIAATFYAVIRLQQSTAPQSVFLRPTTGIFFRHIQPNKKAIGKAIIVVQIQTAAKVIRDIPIKTIKIPKNL